MQLFAENNLHKAYPVSDEAPVSTIGAGDNFNAGVLFGLLKHGITRQMLVQGLSEKQWDQIISYGLRFASESCKSIRNYVDNSFADQMKAELAQG